MAEKIVSAGVFTQEKDLSFLPQGIGEIGACFIGPTIKGPAFIPTVVESYNEFVQKFGDTNEKMYVPYTVRNYMQDAGRATIIRVLGTDGYELTDGPIIVAATGSFGSRLISVLHPTFVVTDDDADSLFEQSTITDINASGSFVLRISGSYDTDSSAFTSFATNKNGTAYSASINPNSAESLEDIFGLGAEGRDPVYNYVLFNEAASASLAEDPAATIYIESGSAGDWDFTDGYLEASTPWILSQKVGGSAQQLFRFHHLSHGTSTSHEIKVLISNIRPAGSVAGSEYGSFTVTIRTVDQSNIAGSPYTYEDSDSRPNILEVFDNVNLDPNSANFISRRIGDKWWTIDDDARVVSNGDYANVSAYVRVEVDASVTAGAYSKNLVPFGFQALFSPIPSAFTQPVAATMVQDQNIGGIYNKRKPWGFDFTADDNVNYMKPLPVDANKTTGSNADFFLSDYNQPAEANFPTPATAHTGSISLDTSLIAEDSRQFIVPFQGGFDGFKPNVQRKTGEHIDAANTQGFNMTQGADGYNAFRKALTAISNPLAFDINMIVMPGVLHQYHSGVTARAIEVCEERADAFYLMDGFSQNSSIANANNVVNGLDTNYAGVYYPWVKVLDLSKNKPIWVPPSVLMAGVYAFSDKVSDEWYAPAGLNRGGLTRAIDISVRLTREDMNDLYEGRINPIATFPNEGIVAWGQKTLQAKPSALDRINVRRLLIAVKKFIASSSRYLVFEQNTSATRNQFLNIVNPYLESVQQRQGLFAFRVVMDETNNTPDVVDRNRLVGELYLQPTKTAEFIILDFNVLPTGATFPGA